MYVVKPPVHIRFDEVASVNFSRVASGVGQSRSFDLEIETKSGANYIFASIEKYVHFELSFSVFRYFVDLYVNAFVIYAILPGFKFLS